MLNSTLLSLSKLTPKMAESIKLTPGRHMVDQLVTLHLKGSILKSEDFDRTPTVDIPFKTVLALVLEKSGFTRERSLAILTEAMTESMLAETSAQIAVAERVNDIDTMMAKVKDMLGALPKKLCAGPVRVDVKLKEIVENKA